MAPISSMILRETQDYHKALMVNSFGTAMQSETLPREKYVGLLRSYAVIYRALEETLRGSSHPSVVQVWRDDLSKTAAFDRDLEFFDAASGAGPAASTAVAPAELLAKKLRASVGVECLGCLYVMEGSTLGAEAVLRRHVESAYGLAADRGTAYFNSGDRAQWQTLNHRLDSAVVDPGEQKTVLAAAIDTYQCVIDVQDRLH
ncbi:biliverdin-producing heme oxygenase [Streptomyces sp. NPDC002520]